MNEIELFRTATGSRVHLTMCPHFESDTVRIRATGVEVETLGICDWSQAEIDGVGRTYHDTIEEALEDKGVPHHLRPELTRLLGLVEYETIYVPNSRTYVAVGRDGRAVAWAGTTFVGYIDRPAVYLPEYVAGAGGGATGREAAWGDVCPDCFTARSVTGSCNCV